MLVMGRSDSRLYDLADQQAVAQISKPGFRLAALVRAVPGDRR
jgi:hypothetical protein